MSNTIFRNSRRSTRSQLHPKHAEPQKQNTRKAEWDARTALWNDESITIFTMDKYNATVMLLSENYQNEMQAILSDSIYRKLTTDPSSRTERQMASLIKKPSIAHNWLKKLTSHALVPPRLYVLPKIHRQDVSLQPIVNCIG
jgi:hypothetical protein